MSVREWFRTANPYAMTMPTSLILLLPRQNRLMPKQRLCLNVHTSHTVIVVMNICLMTRIMVLVSTVRMFLLTQTSVQPVQRALLTVRRGLVVCSVAVLAICPMRRKMVPVTTGVLQLVWWKVMLKCVSPAVIS